MLTTTPTPAEESDLVLDLDDDSADIRPYLDRVSIDYHLHLADQRMDEVRRLHAEGEKEWVPGTLARLEGHIGVLQNGLQDGERIHLSKSCVEVGTELQKVRLQFLVLFAAQFRDEIRSSKLAES